MKRLWFGVLLTGCILPSVEFAGVNDTADTEVLVDPNDTDDTQTDTNDTQDGSDTDDDTDIPDPADLELNDDGMVFMRNQYLLFDSTMVLAFDLSPNATGAGIDPEQGLANFMKRPNSWGFSVSLGSFDEHSFDQLFNEQPLFRASGGFMTFQWMAHGTGYRPLVKHYRYDKFGTGEGQSYLCAEAILGNGGQDAFTLSADELRNGFRFMILSTVNGIDVFIHSSDGSEEPFEYAFGSGYSGADHCEMDFVFEERVWFGRGLSIAPNTDNTAADQNLSPIDIPNLQARVDDITILNETALSYNFQNMEEWRNVLSDLYVDDGSFTFGETSSPEDGWYWYPNNMTPAQQELGEYDRVWDETIKQAGDDYRFKFVNTNGFTESYDADESLNYIYEGNQHWNPED